MSDSAATTEQRARRHPRPVTTFYCPFCGEETIRPTDPPTDADPALAWYRCESCTRAYAVTTPSAHTATFGGDS